MDTFDVAVIGAGIIGQVTAFHLSAAGQNVALIDPAPVSQASYAAAGMLAPVAEVQYQQQELYPLMTASGQEWPTLINNLVARSGLDAEQWGYRATETLVVGVDAADRQYLADLAATQHQHGMAVEQLLPSAARRQEPALNPRLSAAVRIPTDHQVDPRIFLKQLTPLLQAGKHPVTLIRSTAVALEVDDDGVAVVLEHTPAAASQLNKPSASNKLLANHVVVANGLGATTLLAKTTGLDAPHLPLRPVHGDILRIRIPERLSPLLTATVRAVVRGYPVYLVPRTDGTMVLGATSREDTMIGPSLGGVYELLRDAQEVVPGVREAEILEVIARARPGTPDDIPIIGTLHPRLTVSTGYHRHGILLAALGARLTASLASEALRGETQLSAEDTARLATMNPYRFLQTKEAVPHEHYF